MFRVGSTAFAPLQFLLFFSLNVNSDSSGFDVRTAHITNAKGTIAFFNVFVADTDCSRRVGLSSQNEIKENEGLWLDFKTEIKPRMWMKDTRFSLDLLYIKSDGEIVQVERKLVPYSLEIIKSKEEVRFILEISGGLTESLGIKVGHRALLVN